ncbi:VaFE repeat-containing surface-anchored protein [Schaalia sp. ZJ1691]|uniref:VaFE repeat-containing surface-anchored protein n=1 Tax=Schaalia sp. ZJ1691 TaxID=2709404 RepID=UPI0013EDB5CA|nr:VaFE repeat-containing surface-anchored protein [Schaalia sp. ZJ1691]
MIFTLFLTSAHTAHADLIDGPDAGRYISGVGPANTGMFFLGAFESPRNVESGYPSWCIHMWRLFPDPSDTATITTLSSSSQWGPPELDLTTAQMAWLLAKYQADTTPNVRAALSYLIHVNFEHEHPGKDTRQSVALLVSLVRDQVPDVDALARTYVTQARASAATKYMSTVITGEEQREGTIDNISALGDSGERIAGVPVTVSLTGPAVFTETGTQTWTGKTAASPLSLAWRATGTGDVTYQAEFTLPARTTLSVASVARDRQDTVSYGNRPTSDQSVLKDAGRTWKVVGDFQPVAQSSVGVSRILDPGQEFSDSLTVSADPSYGNGRWIETDSGPVPVTFEGTAYWVPLVPPEKTTDIPENAMKLGTASLTFTGPGTLKATVRNTNVSSGFVTWVWTMVKANQKDMVTDHGKQVPASEFIHSDWSDSFGQDDEISSLRWPIDIDTSIAPRKTKSGIYLVDDVWVHGFPSDHPDFSGARGFAPDEASIVQSLLFFPEDLEVTEANKPQAQLIATTTLPAKNGFYPTVGSGEFKVLPDHVGTYVFVTSFSGDDRVKEFVTSVEDATEQFRVEGEVPTVRTTATDLADGDHEIASGGPVTIRDRVCYTGLRPGKEYVFEASLMDQETGKPVVDGQGVPVSQTVTHTPTASDDCTNVDITVNGAMLAGKSTVVFEKVMHEGLTVAIHADIHDEGQTVTTPKPTIGTRVKDASDGDRVIEAKPGVRIDDAVCFSGFPEGTEVELRGTLMNKSTGKLLEVSGKPVTSTTTFTVDHSQGCRDVSFTFDASTLAGETIVVFEEAYIQGQKFASHRDINDREQTVTVASKSDLPVTGSEARMLVLTAILALAAGLGAKMVRSRMSSLGK